MSADNEEIEEQRRLAKGWEPDVDGPFVGQLTGTATLANDFGPGDPRHQKLTDLALHFPYYRAMKRDGSCGFRALAFGFFTTLCASALSAGPDTAAKRLRAAGANFSKLQDLFKPRGWDKFIYEDWLAACVDLSNLLASHLEAVTAKNTEPEAAIAVCTQTLVEKLNDEETGMEVIQYLRAVTSSWMLANHEQFDPYLIDEPRGVLGWCEVNVDPASAEMEELSLSGLYRALIAPTGMEVCVHYLEQSHGQATSTVTYEPDEKDKTENLPRLNLLYRPGHYDLLLS